MISPAMALTACNTLCAALDHPVGTSPERNAAQRLSRKASGYHLQRTYSPEEDYP